MLKKILNSQTKSITLASFILGVAYLGSAVLGLLRDRLLASRFGAGDELDIYYAAFRIPDFVAMLLIMGAVSAVIIPVFSQYLNRSKEEAWEFLSALFNLFLIALISVSAVLVIFAPYLIFLIAPGFSPEKKEMTVMLTRIMFLSPIILGVSNIISGILQVFHRFLVTALAPLMYNLGIIFGILFFFPAMGLPGLAWGVVLGGFLHLCVQLPALFVSGFQYKNVHFLAHPGIPRVIKLMIPRSVGLGAGQINLIIITAIASTLISGSVAVFNLANNLSYLLIGLVAISFSTAVFPSLSLAFSKNAKEEFIHNFSLVFRQILFLILPLSALLFILRAQVVRLVLGAGEFGWIDTRLTAACLGIFSFGLFAQGLILLISKTFYAAQDTKTPAFISCITVIINAFLALLFVWFLRFQNIFSISVENILKLRDIDISIIGLALAFSLAGVFQFILLLFFLQRKFPDLKFKEILASLEKVFIATILMAISAYVVLYSYDSIFSNTLLNTHTVIGLLIQAFSSCFISFLVFLATTLLLKSPELIMILSSLQNKFGKRT